MSDDREGLRRLAFVAITPPGVHAYRVTGPGGNETSRAASRVLMDAVLDWVNGNQVLSLPAGSRLLAIDPRTGRALWEAGSVPQPRFELARVTRDGGAVWKLRCPRCRAWGDLDDDQLHGRASVVCPSEGCGFHETHDFTAIGLD